MWKKLWKTLGKPAEAALAAALLTVAGCGREPAVEVPADAVVRLSEQFTGDFSLTDMNGAAVDSADYRGKLVVVYFGFTSCADVCPLALSRLSAALDLLNAKQQGEIAPLFITVDPARDTPEVLKSYLDFDPRITGLTGDQAAIDAASRSFKVYARRLPLPDSALGYTMDHSSFYYLVDRAGQPRIALHDSLTPSELAVMLRRSTHW
jgi:protein SCO1/2